MIIAILFLFWLTVSASSTLAKICAWYSQLEAFAVAFFTSRFLAGTPFSMLKLVIALCYFNLESLRISFHDFFLCLLNHVSCVFGIAAVFTTAINTTYQTCSKAFTVEFQTLRFWTGALLDSLSRWFFATAYKSKFRLRLMTMVIMVIAVITGFSNLCWRLRRYLILIKFDTFVSDCFPCFLLERYRWFTS